VNLEREGDYITLSMGPHHPATHGVLRLEVTTDGEVVKACKKHIHETPHSVSADGKFSWEEMECLGACVNAPMILIDKDPYEDLTGASTAELIEALRRGETPKTGSQIGRHSSEPVGGATTLLATTKEGV